VTTLLRTHEQPMEPSVACVVVNWNNSEDTNACLSALSQIDYHNLSIIVVDNGSTDGSAARIRYVHPEVFLIETAGNLGFAGGNNAGIKQALKQQPDYIWLLNNDTEPRQNSLTRLVEKAQTDPRLGAVGSVLMYAHDQGKVQAWGGGRINSWLGYTSHAVSPQPDDWFDYITAASILIPRKALEDVGLLDEDFFLYWEDTDFSFRLRKRGWNLGVAADSIVMHKENASTRANRDSFDRYATTSCVRFMLKHSTLPWFSIPLALSLKTINSLLTFRFRRIRYLAMGVSDWYTLGARPSLQESGSASTGLAEKFDGLIVNASRIGSSGGLRNFTLEVLECLSKNYSAVEAVLPRGTPVPKGITAHELPEWLGSSSRVSRLRPVLWLLYVSAFFPGRQSRYILSTTHHVLLFRAHQIVTVHDLRPYFFPDTWTQKIYFHFLLPRSLRKCDGILTVSDASKQDIISVYKIPGDKIHIVPNAVSIKTSGGHSTSENTAEPPYLLMVGASWQHKNAVEVIERYDLWKHNYRLKILAGRGQYSDLLRNLVSGLGIRDHVDFLTNLTDLEVDTLYRNCAAVVYPSRMEGFGLPPLEAMSYGKIAIVSDIPVFRELFGDVPLYVQLGNISSWERAFHQLLEMDSRDDESRRRTGRDLAARFSREQMSIALEQALTSIWNLVPDIEQSCSVTGTRDTL
jgi:GT2 family glycosyltransferase/glycosyltransferase involved in cell wall biosynthesis